MQNSLGESVFFDNIKRAVFIGAHTDDEMVAAGTLYRLVRAGAQVQVLALSRATLPNDETEAGATLVENEFRSSMKVMGVGHWDIRDFDPRTLQDNQKKVRQTIFDNTTSYRPDLAFILSREDDHPDHALVGAACEIVMKNRVPNILRCHFPWNFVPGKCNLFVPLTESELGSKRMVIRAYKSQCFRYDFEKIFMGQAELNGLITKGQPAEAFEVVRLTTGGGK